MTYLPEHIASLIKMELTGALSEDEAAVLFQWMSEDPENELLLNSLKNDAHLKNELQRYYDGDPSTVGRRLSAQFPGFDNFEPISQPLSLRVHFLRTKWLRVAVAVILFLGVGGYLFLRDQDTKPVVTQSTNSRTQKDILPGTNKATLVLGDKSIIELDTASNGILAKQGESEIIKSADGELFYVGSNKEINTHVPVFYQKLITPRGGTYQITLPDGTQAWLNAESSIRFPSVFNDNTRTVEITGEVYFDVKANKSKPFVVKTIKEEIQVLGTSFNANSYAEESNPKTTLISGSVKILAADWRISAVLNKGTILQPGQAYRNGKIITTDVQQDIAWKNGYFNFNHVDLPTAMQQIARWYDVNIIYEGKIPNIHFGGEMQRDLTIQQMLKALGAMGVRFELNGRNLTVKP